jgi:hypothetical protein
MKTQYFDVLITHPNPLAFGKAFAECKSWSSVTFARAFSDTFGVARDDLGTLDTKYGAQYWLRLLEGGQYRWLAWECANGQSFCCWPLPNDDGDAEGGSSFMLVNLTNGSYRIPTSLDTATYREFCNEHTPLLTIKGQPTHPATPPRNTTAAAAVVATEPKAPKKSRKRPAKEKEEETVEPEAKKALFVEP